MKALALALTLGVAASAGAGFGRYVIPDRRDAVNASAELLAAKIDALASRMASIEAKQVQTAGKVDPLRAQGGPAGGGGAEVAPDPAAEEARARVDAIMTACRASGELTGEQLGELRTLLRRMPMDQRVAAKQRLFAMINAGQVAPRATPYPL